MPSEKRDGQVTLRLVVRDPVPHAIMRVQRGATAKQDLVAPATSSAAAIVFELRLDARSRPDGSLELRGPEVQGPPGSRFIYVSSGRYAGDGAPGGRRAKVPLGALDSETIASALARPGSVIVGEIAGRARDGGPAAATVPLIGGWTLASR